MAYNAKAEENNCVSKTICLWFASFRHQRLFLTLASLTRCQSVCKWRRCLEFHCSSEKKRRNVKLEPLQQIMFQVTCNLRRFSLRLLSSDHYCWFSKTVECWIRCIIEKIINFKRTVLINKLNIFAYQVHITRATSKWYFLGINI